MKPMSYMPVTLSGNRDRFFVGRVSVDGSKVITQFEVPTEHEAKILSQRLEYARVELGDLEGTAVSVQTEHSDEHKKAWADQAAKARNSKQSKADS